MKDLVKFEKEIGGDGAKASGSLSVDASVIQASVVVSYPIAKVVEPILKAGDQLVDKLEALIPGDQKLVAAQLKQELREEVMKLIQEQAAKA